SKSTPKNPRTSPVMVNGLEKFSFHLGLSRRINQIAVAAEMIVTIALEMYCSDQMIAAISTNSSKNPTIAASCTARFIKSRWPLIQQYNIKKEPAIIKRIEPSTKGGKA